jgi:acetylglutamate kinase
VTIGHSAPSPVKQRIAATMAKARIFSEAVPFIRQYRGRTVVIKYGGAAMVDEALRASFADDVAMLHFSGIHPVIVHGGGSHISAAMHRQGVDPRWVDGLRVTDADAIRVVQATLAGEINPDLVRLVNSHGSVAGGVSGLDGNLLVARPKDPSLGFVGDVVKVDPGLLTALLDRGFVPVVAPLARGEDGEVYNVNADAAAAAIAVAMGASKLVYLTDVEGLYRDAADPETLISKLSVDEVEALIASRSVSDGMLPKLLACAEASRAGIDRVHILDGRIQHALLLEIFTPEGIGTMITREEEGE